MGFRRFLKFQVGIVWFPGILAIFAILLLPAAFAQQKLVLYAALDNPTLEALISRFEQETGVKVDLLRGGAGEVAARIRAEASAPRGDVFIGGSVDVHGDLALDGLLAKTSPENAELIPDEFKDPEGRYYGWYLGVLGLVLNKDLYTSELPGVPRPMSWDELIKPEWKGLVSSSNPATSGGAYILLCTQIFRMERFASLLGMNNPREAGEEGAFNWFRKFSDNASVITTRATEPITLTAQGESTVGMSWAHDILVSVEEGQPVELIVPPDTGAEIGGASVIEGGPHPEAAEMFLNFVLSREAQEIDATVGAKRYPVTPGVISPPGAPPLSSFSLAPFDRNWCIANRERLLDKWERVIGR